MSDRQPHVLLVDGLSETEQVLKAVFEPLGHPVQRIRGYETAALRQSQAKVVILHDSFFRSDGERTDVSRVVVGRQDPEATAVGSSLQEFSSPFDYRDLVSTLRGYLENEDRAAA